MTVTFAATFEDVDVEAWSRLVAQMPAHPVFCLPGWVSTWWTAMGGGVLRVATAVGASGPSAVVPFFEVGHTFFLVGCVGSDHVDLAWDREHPDVLEELLREVFAQFPHLVGVQLHQLERGSDTVKELAGAAHRLGLVVTEEDPIEAPYVRLDEARVAALTGKKSLRRHENWFRSHGELAVEHLADVALINDALPVFFDQHRRRWEGTGSPSLFEDDRQRLLFEALVEPGVREGWLRFSRVSWNERPIAFHYGFCFGGRYLWYKPSFDVDLAERSPGEVLLRHLIWEAGREEATIFDFGLGSEAFKDRFADERTEMITVGLYPARVAR